MQKFMCLLLCAAVLFGMAGCASEKEDEIIGIIFERGHGSMWGNQFYIHVEKTEIVQSRYIPENAQDQQTRQNIPITQQQWEELLAAVQMLKLQEECPSLWESLLGNSKLDGGEYRELILIWSTPKGEKEMSYQWPGDERAEKLEILLTQLIME